MHVKTEDEVVVLAGKDRGFTGEVIEADPDRERVRVRRRNMIVKHEQPNPMMDEEGERVETEGWMDASNVALYVEEDGEKRPVRVGYRYVGAGDELYDDKHRAKESFDGDPPEVVKKVRIARQTGELLDDIHEE